MNGCPVESSLAHVRKSKVRVVLGKTPKPHEIKVDELKLIDIRILVYHKTDDLVNNF